MSEEIWRQCVDEHGFQIGKYEVSNKGRLRNSSGVIMAQSHETYKRIILNKKHYYVHRLVALAFPEICGNWFDGATVDHLNGQKHDNRAENLCFKTLVENMANPVTRPSHSESARKSIRKIHEGSTFKMAFTKSRPVVADGLTQVFMNAGSLADFLGVTKHAVYDGIKHGWKICGFTVRYAGDR